MRIIQGWVRHKNKNSSEMKQIKYKEIKHVDM